MLLLFRNQGAAGGAIAGTSTLTFSQSGAETAKGALAGGSPLAFGQQGTAAGQGALLGTSTLTWGQTGTLGGKGSLAGVSTLFSNDSAAETANGALTATASVLFGGNGTLGGQGSAAGSATVVFGQTANISGGSAGPMTALAGLTFGTAATLTGTGGALNDPAGGLRNRSRTWVKLTDWQDANRDTKPKTKAKTTATVEYYPKAGDRDAAKGIGLDAALAELTATAKREAERVQAAQAKIDAMLATQQAARLLDIARSNERDDEELIALLVAEDVI